MDTVNIPDLIVGAKDHVRRIVEESSSDDRVVIARYAAAFAVNFTDWIGKTLPWARHELAQYAIRDNLRCEAVEDHVGMLLSFAELSGAMPDRRDYEVVARYVETIRKMLADPLKAGLFGVMLCATLENTSEIFIPDLAERAKQCGCTDFTYTDRHGAADVEHSQAFVKATEAELTMGYRKHEALLVLSDANEAAIALLERIYG